MAASHIYADNGDYTITICVSDDLSQTCNTTTTSVSNVAPTVIVGDDRDINEGDTVTLGPATFSDPGFDVPLDSFAPDFNAVPASTTEDFTATIDWGDGNNKPFDDIIVAEIPGSETSSTTGTVQAVHFYGDNGTYTVEICVFDDDGGSGCDTLTVEVFNVAPSIEAGPGRVINEGDTVFIGPPPGTGDHQ